MDEITRQRAEELFHLAVELRGEQRAAFLDAQCGSGGPLRTEVESLLAHAKDDSFLQRPAYHANVAPASLPQLLGHYRVLRLIGEGNMGSVYEAEQEYPRRRVALKLMRPGPTSPSLLRRFRREAQVLARLQHPGIAQIYEAGTFGADGSEPQRPYFAMELVTGSPVDEHARSRGWGGRQRLALVAALCDAVHYAHQQGVIHRDLKPANILVDDRGQPKVLDFGVARATGSDLRATTLRTEVGQVVGTLSYMSPEQIAARPEELDTRSDVYALGVILYQLLAGWLPYDLAGRSLPEAGRMIREEDPPRLRVANAQYRGDVETIVAKAMAKEPDRRYQSVAELAADIRRYLADEPIVARPAGTFYQFRKFARRNRSLVAVVAAAMAVLVVALVAVSALAIRFQRQKVRAEDMNWFMESVTTAAMPYRSVTAGKHPAHFGANAKLLDVLDQFVKQLDARPLRDPVAEAGIRQKMATIYLGASRYAEGVRNAQQALQLVRVIEGQDKLRLEAQQSLAYSRNFLGDSFEAVRLARELVAQCETRYGKVHEQTLDALLCLHLCLNYGGYAADSAAVLERLLGRLREGPERAGDVAFLVKAELARVLIDKLHRPVEGEALARQALAEGVSSGEDKTNGMALAHFAIGRAAARRQCFQEAEEHCRKGLAIWTEVAGETSALEFQVLLGAYVGEQRGREEEGLAIIRDAGARRAQEAGADDPVTAWLASVYARNLAHAGRLQEAEQQFRRYFAIMQRSGIPETHARARECHGFASVLLRQNKPDEAEWWLCEGLRIARSFTREQWARHWWDDRLLLVELARLVESQGRAGEAEQLHEVVRKRLGERGDPWQAHLVALALHEGGRNEESVVVARIAVEGLHPVQEQVPGEYVRALDTLACALRASGELENAEGSWRIADGVWSASPQGIEDYEPIAVRFGECLTARGKFEEAERVLLRTLDSLRSGPRANAAGVEAASKALASLHDAWKRPQDGAGGQAIPASRR